LNLSVPVFRNQATEQNQTWYSKWIIKIVKNVWKDFYNHFQTTAKVSFMRNAFARVKKPFSTGTKQCVVLLAFALVCNFYQLRTLLTGVKSTSISDLSIMEFFYFNKVCSFKILTSARCHRKVLPPWPHDSLSWALMYT